MSINLNFASNENQLGAQQAAAYLRQASLWQTGPSLDQLKVVLAKQFQVKSDQVLLALAGRSLLYLLFSNLNLPVDSEVLVQAFTCSAVVLPALAAGLKVKYVDIEAKTWSMSLADLKRKYSQHSHLLVLQHTFGMLPEERQTILAWAEQKKLIVIEDLAHGYSPELLKQPAETYKLLSFGRSKFFSSVYGGALVVLSKTAATKLNQQLAKWPQPSRTLIKQALWYKQLAPWIKKRPTLGKLLHRLLKNRVFNREISDQERAGHYDPWLNYQLPNVFAALILSQLEQYQELVAQRRAIAALYQRALPNNLTAKRLPLLRFPLLVKNPELVLSTMAKQGYVLGDWYRQVVAPADLALDQVNYQLGACPRAEEFSRRVINLPLNLNSDQAQDLLIQVQRLVNVS